MEIQLKKSTSQRIEGLFKQMQLVQNQIGERVDTILLTVCEENDIDLNKWRPKITEDFSKLVFEEIVGEGEIPEATELISKEMRVVRDEEFDEEIDG